MDIASVASLNVQGVKRAIIVPLDDVPPLNDCELKMFQSGIRDAHAVVEQCWSSHPPERIGISFNGGKDSVVMLELLLSIIGPENVAACRTFMFGEEDEFEEVVEFRESYFKSRVPGGSLMTLPHELGIKGGLELMKQEYGLEAVFIGTRRDDPSGRYQKAAIERTTSDWPDMIRYCPVFDIAYHQVWFYLASRSIPVCALYSRGYTSLGSMTLTVPNPALRDDALRSHHEEGGTSLRYLPAWRLLSSDKERDCRLHAAAVSKSKC